MSHRIGEQAAACLGDCENEESKLIWAMVGSLRSDIFLSREIALYLFPRFRVHLLNSVSSSVANIYGAMDNLL